MSAGQRLPDTPEPMHYWRGQSGLALAGDSWGEGQRRLVVLLHGGGQTRHAWRYAGKRLAEAGYRVVAYDARGHGDSEWAADRDYSSDAMVADLTLVTEAMGDPNPVLVGASMGGITSLIAIGEGHVQASALVLVDTATRHEVEGVQNVRSFMSQRPEGFDSLEEVAEAIASYQPHRKPARSLDGLAKNVRLGKDGRFHWHWDPVTFQQEIDQQSRGVRLENCGRRLTIPTLLVRGGLSDVVSEAGAQHFLEVCPHAEYVSVQGAAHMVAGDQNDQFCSAVVDFVTRVTPP